MLVSSYPRNSADSSAVFLRYLFQHLRDLGVDVHVIAPADSASQTVVEDGITIHRFQYFPKRWQALAYGSGILPNLGRNRWLWLQVPFFLLFMFRATRMTNANVHPDIVHAHWVIPQGLVAVCAAWFRRIPVVVTAHGGDAFALRSRGPLLLKRFVLNRASTWTANTRATAAALTDADVRTAPHIIPMGVDIEHFRSGDRGKLRTANIEGKNVVLFVGRLVEKKGVADLLAAYSSLPAVLRARTALWIVGDGEQRPALESLAHRLGIFPDVTFFGKKSNAVLPDYYAAADLFVGPSTEAKSGDTEGQGVVFLEAFAARLCVLATRVGGIPEIVEDGHTGLLAAPRDPNDLARQLVQLLGDHDLRHRLAESAFRKVSRFYDWATVAAEFHRLYLSAHKGHAY